MVSTKELGERRAALLDKVNTITYGAKAADRDVTDDEDRQVEELLNEIALIDAQLVRPENAGRRGRPGRHSPTTKVFDNPHYRPLRRGNTGELEVLQGPNGPMDVYRSDQKMADYAEVESEEFRHARLGNWVRWVVTGDDKRFELEAAMGRGNNTLGGYLIPDPLSRQWFDLARNRSVLLQAGARTVDMMGESLGFARVVTDPTFSAQTENEEFSETQIVFDKVNLHDQTIGGLVPVSRQCIEDSYNAADIIESVLTSALWVEMDRIGLVGSGSQEPDGLTLYPDVQEIGSVGSVTWDDFLDGIERVKDDNYYPNGCIYSAQVENTLAKLLVNSEVNSYVTPPPAVSALPQLVTEQMGNSVALVGDFTKAIFGLRVSPRLEITSTGGDAFKKHQVLFKAYMRMDFACEHGLAFCKLSGIS